jgi:hypothetical protein
MPRSQECSPFHGCHGREEKVFWLSELLRLGRHGEARDWQRSVRQRQAVKLPIKMTVKDVQEEADLLNAVELLSSPH